MAIRIVIDTNIWISYLLTNRLSYLDTIFDNQEITFLYNEHLIDEIMQVAQRPKFENIISPNDLFHLIEILEGLGEHVIMKSKTDQSRDKKDNFLLSLSHDGNADYLISGDNDLLFLEDFKQTNIIKLSEFKSILKKL